MMTCPCYDSHGPVVIQGQEKSSKGVVNKHEVPATTPSGLDSGGNGMAVPLVRLTLPPTFG
jgi:hypothetical protein